MSCKNLRSQLSAFIDREIGGEEALAVRAHLRDCENCAREERELRRVREIMTTLPAQDGDDAMADRILHRIFAPKPAPSRRWSAVAGLAVCSFAMFGAFVLHRASVERQRHASEAQDIQLEIARDRMMMRDSDMTVGAPIVSASYVGH